MIDPWIWATGAIIVGLLSGLVGAALVRRIILKGREDRPEAHDAARATATFLFLFFAAVGVIVAIGFTNPSFALTAYGATLLTSAEIVLGINAVAGGSFTLPFSLNPGAPVGADFFAQAGWFDLAAMGNVAFTNGVRVVVGE